jgi:putative ABC transport system permease protein
MRAPGFAAIVVLTLALGIGANTAIFSLVKAVLLQPLPYGEPERLTMLWGRIEKGALTHLSGPEVRDYAAETATFASVAVYLGSAANLTGGHEPERVVAAVVTPNIFATLGVPALIGRAFAPSDDPQGIAREIVLSYSLWQRRFGGSPDILERQILVDGAQARVIGVMPAGFKLPLDFSDDRPSELWRPLDLRTSDWGFWGNHSLIGVARLRDGVTPERATMTMRALEDRWIRDKVGGGWNDKDITRRAALPIKDLVLGGVRYALWVLFGAVGAILIIACANVANLMLARSDGRHREIAVRTAIGASRARVVRQLLTESLLLSGLGGAIGLGLAYLGLRVLLVVRPSGIPRIDVVGLDGGVLAFTMFLAVATGLLFGVAPALALTRSDLNTPLKEGGWGGSGGRMGQRFRGSLAVTQMAFSVVLLIGAVLLVRSFIELRRIDLGFNPQHALTVRTTLPVAAYPADADVIRTVRTLRRRFAEFPGVQSVGATRLLPLSGTIGDWSITLEGRPKLPGENPNGDWQVVTPGYFESMGMTLVRGRFFAETDDENAPVVAIVNDTMARRYWPNDDAVGKRFRANSDRYPWITVVGVVGQVRHNAITEKPRAEMYVPHAQWGAAGGGTRRAMTFVLRTHGDPLAVLGHVREAVRSIDPNLPLAEVRTLEQVTGDALSQARFTTLLLGLFAGLALTLATIGIYGVISLLVARRRREIGIRIALGARPMWILGMVVGRGMTLTAFGVVAGLVAAVALTRVVANLLYGVTRFDPLTFAAVPVVLTCVALVACVIPARRAARVSPIVALREE